MINEFKLSNGVHACLFIIITASLSHILYSSYGFNPTDDGFTLAYSRRIMNGEIPHRDFIIIRPALSPLLHIPELVFGGSAVYWWSRFIFFFQWACIAWLSMECIVSKSDIYFSWTSKYGLSIISFVLGCGSFPAMAWHTIDGLFLSIIGLYLIIFGKHKLYIAGYFFIGLACLCKQNYLILIPAAIVLFKKWKNMEIYFAALAPVCIYIIIIYLSNGINEAKVQILSQNDLYGIGVASYTKKGIILYFFIGILGGIVLCKIKVINQLIVEMIFFGLILNLAYKLVNNSLFDFSYKIFSLVFGILLIRLGSFSGWNDFNVRVGLFFVGVAWACSISVGYNSPVLVCGILTVIFFVSSMKIDSLKNANNYLIVVSAIILMISFNISRRNYVYRDLSERDLNYKIEDVVSAGDFIKTNYNSYNFLYELNNITKTISNDGLNYVIMPDSAFHWVNSKQNNILPIDWVQGTELGVDDLRLRVVNSLNYLACDTKIIVQKFKAADLAVGNIDLVSHGVKHYYIVNYVRENFKKINEFTYFDVYVKSGCFE